MVYLPLALPMLERVSRASFDFFHSLRETQRHGNEMWWFFYGVHPFLRTLGA